MRDEAQGPEDCMEAASVSTRRQMDGARGDVRLWAEHQPGGPGHRDAPRTGSSPSRGPICSGHDQPVPGPQRRPSPERKGTGD